MKKILAILLTATMLVSLLAVYPSTTAGASEPVPEETYEPAQPDTEAPTTVTEMLEPYAQTEADAQEETLADTPEETAAETEADSQENEKIWLDEVEYEKNDADLSSAGGENAKPVFQDNTKETTEQPEYVEGEAVVLLEDENALDELKKEVEVKEVITLDGVDGELNFAVVTDKGSTTEEIIDELSDEEGVESVVPNAISKPTAITNDPYSMYQWALSNTGQNGGTKGVDVNPETAWSKAASTKRQCVVAVMDTGIDATHNDLKSVLWKNIYTALGKKGAYGYDFTGTFANHTPKDDDGHGTHVAGIIAASANNNSGISGINKTGVKIMALKIMDEDGCTFANELRAFNYIIKAKKLGVNIKAVNCSYGGLGSAYQRDQYDKIFNTLGSLGIVTCVSAGNEEDNIDYKEKGDYYLPAASRSKYCLTVAATGPDGRLASYSNYGSGNVDIAAPGSDILSTVSYNAFQPSIYSKSAISGLCSYYQGYEKDESDSFGYSLKSAKGGTFADDESYSISEAEFNGTGSRSMKVSMTNAYNKRYAFEIPYTLSSVTGTYSVAAMVKCSDRNVKVTMYDIPAYDNWDNGPSDYTYPDETWDKIQIDINPYSTSNYRMGTSRRLGFIIEVNNSYSAAVYFDHIAISKQSISPSKFGKLDYLDGTSMACPYVAGAVALVANAYPTLSASDIITALKNSSTKSSALKSYVNGGRLLNLKNIAKYAKAYYSKATPKITKLSKTTAGVKLTIGKVKGVARYRVFYHNGKSWVKLGDTKTTTFTHKRAKSGKKYRYTVRCMSSNGKKTLSDFNHTGWKITYVAAPKAPTLRNIEAGVRITFKRVAGAAKYRIFRKTGNGKWVKLCDTTKTTIVDRTVRRGYTYRYTVQCLNKKGKYASACNNGSVISRVR